jgi:hypothetical protein
MIHELVSQADSSKPVTSPDFLQVIASTTGLDPAKQKLLLDLARSNRLHSPFHSKELANGEGDYFLHLPLVLGGQPFHLLERGGWKFAVDFGKHCWISHQIFVSNTRALPAGPAALLPLAADMANWW